MLLAEEGAGNATERPVIFGTLRSAKRLKHTMDHGPYSDRCVCDGQWPRLLRAQCSLALKPVYFSMLAKAKELHKSFHPASYRIARLES